MCRGNIFDDFNQICEAYQMLAIEYYGNHSEEYLKVKLSLIQANIQMSKLDVALEHCGEGRALCMQMLMEELNTRMSSIDFKFALKEAKIRYLKGETEIADGIMAQCQMMEWRLGEEGKEVEEEFRQMKTERFRVKNKGLNIGWNSIGQGILLLGVIMTAGWIGVNLVKKRIG